MGEERHFVFFHHPAEKFPLARYFGGGGLVIRERFQRFQIRGELTPTFLVLDRVHGGAFDADELCFEITRQVLQLGVRRYRQKIRRQKCGQFGGPGIGGSAGGGYG